MGEYVWGIGILHLKIFAAISLGQSLEVPLRKKSGCNFVTIDSILILQQNRAKELSLLTA